MRLDDDIGRTQLAKVEQPALYLHCAVFLPDGRVLGDEIFRLVALQGQESISNPFEFQLTLHGNSERPDKDPVLFSEIVGRRVTFGVQRPYTPNTVLDRSTSAARFRDALAGRAVPGLSLFNGMATAFAMHEPGVYRMTVKPALWKLMLTNRYCLYEQRSIVEAIEAVFKRYPDVRVSFRKLTDAQNIARARTQDWLQAGETDYEFVQRLMSKAHLYYYFEHDGRDHVAQFANTPEYPELERGRDMRYTYTSADALGLEQPHVITEYGYEQTLTHTGVDSMFVREQAAWESDTVARFKTYPPLDSEEPGDLAFRLYKIYQYGGSRSMTSDFAKATASTIKAAATHFSGASHCADFRAGYKFRALERLEPAKQKVPVRPTLDKQWFVLTQVSHEASLGGTYRNQFQATEAGELITPFSERDTHQGTILATVVEADAGQGRPPDTWKYYTKNNFDPEPHTATDVASEQSVTPLTGVCVRFSTDGDQGPVVWVKLAAHMQTVPEIGTNVLVGRASDESEMPEIQAIVQANGQYTVTPSRWTADTRVGSTYSTSYGDGKSIRYGSRSQVDLNEAIGIVNREYDSGRFRDASYSQGAHFSYDTSEKGRDGILAKSESYGSTYSHAEAAERKSYEEVGYTRSEQEIGDSDSYSAVTGKSYSKSTVGESETHHTVERGTTAYETVQGKSYSESTHGRTESHSTIEGTSDSYDTIKGKRYSESSYADVESHVTMSGGSKSYETIDGKRHSESTVKGGSYAKSHIDGVSESVTEVPGVDTNTSRIGVANRNSAIGLSNENSIVGLSESNHVAGSSTQISASGNINQVSAVGAMADISAIGAIARVSAIGTGTIVEAYGANVKVNGRPASLSAGPTGTEIELPTIKVIN